MGLLGCSISFFDLFAYIWVLRIQEDWSLDDLIKVVITFSTIYLSTYMYYNHILYPVFIF